MRLELKLLLFNIIIIDNYLVTFPQLKINARPKTANVTAGVSQKFWKKGPLGVFDGERK